MSKEDRWGWEWSKIVCQLMGWPRDWYYHDVVDEWRKDRNWTIWCKAGLSPKEAVGRYLDPASLRGRLIWARLQAPSWNGNGITFERVAKIYYDQTLKVLEQYPDEMLVTATYEPAVRARECIPGLIGELADLYRVNRTWLLTGKSAADLEPVATILAGLNDQLRETVTLKLTRSWQADMGDVDESGLAW